MTEQVVTNEAASPPRACCVLVADDEPAIRDVLRLGLRRAGLSVCQAADGQEALNLYRRRHAKIDVVLLDVRMPRLDGPQALVAIQAVEPRVTSCFMSGDFGGYTEAELFVLGAQAIVKKPFDVPELAILLRVLAGAAEPWEDHAPRTRRTAGGGAARGRRDGLAREPLAGAASLRLIGQRRSSPAADDDEGLKRKRASRVDPARNRRPFV